MPRSLGAFKLALAMSNEDEDGKLYYNHMNFFLIRNVIFEKDQSIRFIYFTSSRLVDGDGKHIRLRKPDETMIEFFDNIAKEYNGYWVERHVYDADQYVLYGRFEYDDVEDLNTVTGAYFHPQPETKELPPETDDKVIHAFPAKKKDV